MNLIYISVPPKFIDRGENEVMAREGTNITLSCKVKGYPLPTVTWEREGGKELSEANGHRTLGLYMLINYWTSKWNIKCKIFYEIFYSDF